MSQNTEQILRVIETDDFTYRVWLIKSWPKNLGIFKFFYFSLGETYRRV